MSMQVVVAAILLSGGSAGGGVVIQSEAYRIWGGVGSLTMDDPPVYVEESYDTTSGVNVSDRVDGLFGNYAESSAGRSGQDFFADAASAELAASGASGAAGASAIITFVSIDPIVDLDMHGAITWIQEEPDGHHGFSSASVQVTDLTSATTLLDFAPTIAEGTPTTSAAPWSSLVQLNVDPTHVLALTITSHGYGYEPHPVGVASTTVSLDVVPGSVLSCIALLGGAGLIRRR